MKKILGDVVWVQKYDIAFIMNDLRSMPICIVDALFGSDNAFFIMNGGNDANAFSNSFTGQAAEWLKMQPWLLDIDEWRKKTAQEIYEILAQEEASFKRSVSSFYEHDQHWQSEHFNEADDIFSKQSHRLRSMNLMIKWLDKEIKFKIPGEKKRLFS